MKTVLQETGSGVIDITKRTSNSSLALLDNLPALIWRSGADAKCDYFNQTWLEFTGRRADQEMGDGWAEGVHPEDLASCLQKYLEAFHARRPFKLEYRLRRFDGEYRWVLDSGQPIYDLDNQFSGYIGSCLDITERKQAEEVQRTSEARFRGLVDSNAQGVLFWNTKGEITGSNDAFLKLVGYTREDVETGRVNWAAMTPPEYAHLDRRALQEIAATGICALFEKEFIRSDGSRVPILIGVSAFEDHLDGGVAFIIDITDRKVAEEGLKNSHLKLRALSARLQSVREVEAARIAREIHDELGQKLTGLKMDLLWTERKLGELAGSVAVNAILDRVVGATELVDSITTTVQEIATDLRPVVLDKLGLGSALENEARRFQGRTGLVCEVRLAATEPILSPELSIALFRVFQECLTNVARHARASKVEVELKVESEYVTMRVEDDGCGITDAELANSGSLGLLGMRERAALLGGEIVLQRRGETGTIVTARIPRNATATPIKGLV